MKEGYIKQKDRKKILLITDDIRVHSGVAQIGREMVLHTSHRYNWVQLAGAVKHPDKGKRVDLSQDNDKLAGIEDSSVILYPTDGYGNPDVLRGVIETEKPDAIFLITDPRYFTWIFQIENQIRKNIPIVYLNIWDSMPTPMYNREFYESCDALFGISKQTKAINEIVLGDKVKNKIIKYVPHGLNEKMFFPLDEKDEELTQFKKYISRGKECDFMLLFNSRNIRRKSISDTILAWKLFLDELPQEKRDKCTFVLHTDPVSDHGTDLGAVIEYFFPEGDGNVVISNDKLPTEKMNYLYNSADGVILILSLVGSPQTPYIYDDRCSFEDASNRIMELYKMGDKERKARGKKGMEWALSDEAGFTSQKMSNRIIEGLDELFDTWKPREKFEFLKDTDYEPRVLKHKIIY